MSKIEWTERTWNPTTGCNSVSEGCDRCYAMTMAARLKAMGQPKYQKDGDPRTSGPGFGLTLHPDTLETPLDVRKPTMWFVNSMSDLFHHEVPEGFIERVFITMNDGWPRSPHTYQILTKRPQRMKHVVRRIYAKWSAEDALPWPPLPNVWLGTSIELDKYAYRANHVRATPAAVRFLSLEPLLGPLPSLDLTGIDWCIVGGESGPGARPMHPDWVRDIRDRCIGAGVPFFFKQHGNWRAPETQDEWNRPGLYLHPDGSTHPWPGEWHIGTGCAAVVNLGKKAAGRVLDGRTWDEMPS